MYTFEEIYNRAIDRPGGSYELKAKDWAIYTLECEILEETGVDVNEFECPEDEIFRFLEESKYNYYFDDMGILILVE